MGIFSKLFGSKQQKSEQFTPEISHLVAEASHIPEEFIEHKYVGRTILTSSMVEMGSETPITKAIDRVPHDYDSKFKLAAQWYMNNSSLDDIVW